MTKEEAMRHWDALKTTDPKYTKKVEFGRKFTSINSQWQLQRMTEQFGPVGEGWGYSVEHSIAHITPEYVLAIADVTIWSGPGKAYGPVRGMSPIVEKGKNGLHFDDDAGKKAMTDALTKGLSHLGLSADVFLGLFDDVKYVNRVAQEFKDAPIEAVDPADRDLVQGDGTKSQYQVERHKAALRFVNQAMEAFDAMSGATDVNVWYSTANSPKGKSTNRDSVERMKAEFPDLAAKLEAAANEVRLRTGARLQ